MTNYYNVITVPTEELQTQIRLAMKFDRNGYLIDPNLLIQKRLEDIYAKPILSIYQTTRMNQMIFIVYDPNGYVQNNRLSGRRMAVITGDFQYIQSVFQTMIDEHPQIPPAIIFDSYISQCTPQERMMLRKWMEEAYQFS